MAEQRAKQLEAEHFGTMMALRTAEALSKSEAGESKTAAEKQVVELRANLGIIESAYEVALAEIPKEKSSKPN